MPAQDLSSFNPAKECKDRDGTGVAESIPLPLGSELNGSDQEMRLPVENYVVISANRRRVERRLNDRADQAEIHNQFEEAEALRRHADELEFL